MASLFISCAIKSSFLPIPSVSSNVSRICEMWLFKRTVSSSVQILSAYKITSAAILFSSTGTSKSSWILSSSFLRYSSTICGERSSTCPTSVSMPESLFKISFFKFSPSVVRVSTNCANAPSNAICRPLHKASSSSGFSSIVNTSGQCANVETRISLSIPNDSSICLKYLMYSAASVSLYLSAA